MELIERYINAVGHKIWSKNRKGIEEELRSILYDNLEEISESGEPDEEKVKEMLKNYGSPSQVASRYGTSDKYIIGPRVYDAYIFVLKIVLTVLFFLTTAGVIISIVTQANDLHIGIRILELIPRYITAFATGFGFVTIIFFLIERFDKGVESELTKVWNPDKLPKLVKDNDKIRRTGQIVNIMFIVLALILFNAYPERVAVFYSDGSGWMSYPSLSKTALEAYLPFWNIIWGISLVNSIILIRTGKWNYVTRIVKLVNLMFIIAVLIYMISGPGIFNTDSLVAVSDAAGENLADVFKILSTMMKFIYGIVALLVAGDIGYTVYKFIKEKR
jgi:hypothetical protein